MLIQRPIGKLANLPHPAHIDWFDVRWEQCLRRAFAGQTRGGRRLRVLLPLGQGLRHEDVLWASANFDSCIALNILPAEMLVATQLDAAAMARLGYEIGNLHVPMELDGDHVIAPADGPIEEAFERAGVKFELQSRRFQPTCRSLIEVAVAAKLQIMRRPPENA